MITPTPTHRPSLSHHQHTTNGDVRKLKIKLKPKVKSDLRPAMHTGPEWEDRAICGCESTRCSKGILASGYEIISTYYGLVSRTLPAKETRSIPLQPGRKAITNCILRRNTSWDVHMMCPVMGGRPRQREIRFAGERREGRIDKKMNQKRGDGGKRGEK